MSWFWIVETDNFGGDYPNEKFVNLPCFGSKEAAEGVAKAINDACSGESCPRYWKVVEDGYKLGLGFEP